MDSITLAVCYIGILVLHAMLHTAELGFHSSTCHVLLFFSTSVEAYMKSHAFWEKHREVADMQTPINKEQSIDVSP